MLVGLVVLRAARGLPPLAQLLTRHRASSYPRVRWPRPTHRDAEQTARASLAEQRRALPDQPGVYLFRDGAGRVHLRRQGQVGAQARRLALLQGAGAEQPRARRDGRRASSTIECVVVASEAEALLAEQSFIKQYRPRFNIRLRDDKSYPFIAISLDEDFPRVYFTRERHRAGPRLLRPLLERQARARRRSRCSPRCSCSAPAPAPSRGGAAAARAWTTTSSAARRPAWATSPGRSTARASTACIDFLSGRFRAIERDLEARMRAAAARRGVRAGDARAQPPARGPLAAGAPARRPASRSARFDAVAVALDGREANAQVFQVRDGVLSDRQSFYLSNETERDARRGGGGVHAPVLRRAHLDPGAARRAARARRARRRSPTRSRSRREGPVELRAAERGEKRRILELAERNARLALDQERLRSERRRQGRVEALEGLQLALGLDVPPVRIECFDISNLGGTHTVASMVVFEGGAPKKSDYRRFKIRSTEGAARRLRLDGRGARRRFAQWERQADISPHDPAYDPSFASLPNLVVIDGGKGQLSAGLGAAARASASAASRSSRSPSASRRCSCPAARAARARPLHARAAAAAARPRRGPPLRDHPPPQPPRPRDDELAARRAARRRPCAQARAARPTSARPRRSLAASREELQAVPGRAGEGRARAARAICTARAETQDLHRASVPPRHNDDEMAVIRPLRPLRAAAGRAEKPVARVAAAGPRRDHRLLRRRQVDGDERVRGRGLLLRRQPAAGDDPLAGRAVRAQGLQGRARGGRLRRARRRLLRGACRRSSTTSTRSASTTTCCSSRPPSRRSSTRYKETRRRHPLAPEGSVAAGRRLRARAARAAARARRPRDRHDRHVGRDAAREDRRRAPAAPDRRAPGGDVHELRLQARAAARGGSRVRRALPAQPPLRARPARAHRPRRARWSSTSAATGAWRSSTSACTRCSTSCCRSTSPRARRTW